MHKEDIYEILGYVKASKYRKLILKLLHNEILTPKEIAERLNTTLAYVSKILRELEQKGLVKCLNPDAVKGRVYTLTEKGKEIAKLV